MLRREGYNVGKSPLNVIHTWEDTSDVLITILAFSQYETIFALKTKSFIELIAVWITNRKEPGGNPH